MIEKHRLPRHPLRLPIAFGECSGKTFIAATIDEMKFVADKRSTWEH